MYILYIFFSINGALVTNQYESLYECQLSESIYVENTVSVSSGCLQ